MKAKSPKGMDFDRTKPFIVIDNQSTLVTDDQIKGLIPALQAQIDEDFRPAWGLTAKLKFKTKLKQPHMGLIIKDESDEKGDMGYHFRDGYPVAYIFAKDSMADINDIDGLSSTISHEILEMIADPGVNLLAAQPPPGRAHRCPHRRRRAHGPPAGGLPGSRGPPLRGGHDPRQRCCVLRVFRADRERSDPRESGASGGPDRLLREVRGVVSRSRKRRPSFLEK